MWNRLFSCDNLVFEIPLEYPADDWLNMIYKRFRKLSASLLPSAFLNSAISANAVSKRAIVGNFPMSTPKRRALKHWGGKQVSKSETWSPYANLPAVFERIFSRAVNDESILNLEFKLSNLVCRPVFSPCSSLLPVAWQVLQYTQILERLCVRNYLEGECPDSGAIFSRPWQEAFPKTSDLITEKEIWKYTQEMPLQDTPWLPTTRWWPYHC